MSQLELDYRTKLVTKIFFTLIPKKSEQTISGFPKIRYLMTVTARLSEKYNPRLIKDLQEEIIDFMTERYITDDEIDLEDLNLTLEDIAAEVMDEHSLDSCEITDVNGTGIIVERNPNVTYVPYRSNQ